MRQHGLDRYLSLYTIRIIEIITTKTTTFNLNFRVVCFADMSSAAMRCLLSSVNKQINSDYRTEKFGELNGFTGASVRWTASTESLTDRSTSSTSWEAATAEEFRRLQSGTVITLMEMEFDESGTATNDNGHFCSLLFCDFQVHRKRLLIDLRICII